MSYILIIAVLSYGLHMMTLWMGDPVKRIVTGTAMDLSTQAIDVDNGDFNYAFGFCNGLPPEVGQLSIIHTRIE